MTNLIVPEIVCPQCGAAIDVNDERCRRCGAATGNRQRPNWLESRRGVLTMLFLVLYAFGLPMLWRSRHFTPAGKIVVSVLVTAWTVLLLWLIWLALYQVLISLRQLWQAWQPSV